MLGDLWQPYYDVLGELCIWQATSASDCIQVALSKLTIREQSADELAQFGGREVHQVTFVEEVHDIGLSEQIIRIIAPDSLCR